MTFYFDHTSGSTKVKSGRQFVISQAAHVGGVCAPKAVLFEPS